MKKFVTLSSILALTSALSTASAATTVDYWLWDSAQLPAYQQCAKDFTKLNPDINIKITQKGWDDYWTGITTGFVAGTAPDVFTNHLSKYPEFAANGQIVDFAPWIKRDSVKTNIYLEGLYSLWGRDGKQYGLPKDWDTVAIIYNKDMLKKAGISEKTLNALKWNPKDGGSFEKVIAQLTLDQNGNNGLSKNFDKTKVKQYGLLNPYDPNPYGQTGWSWLAVSNGFKYNDGLYATKYYYDDPRLAETIQWLTDLSLKKGFLIPYKDIRGLGANSQFVAGKGAMTTDGSWMIKWYIDNAKFDVGFALLPVGPTGKRTSMFNGLADSIWVGSKKKEEAWKWVKYLGSPACENVVGKYGAVFPAVNSGVNLALATHKKNGADVSAFTKTAKAKGSTFLFPITDNASQINSIMTTALENVFLGKTPAAEALKEANQKVNALFK
ncbi:ABC transporter substrate-binding protein [Deinococcus cellulosilyticus]|uniref:Sugar ABC transporter substrate-binding protein n=1 Tax=Deinococcus cellulosilyticus (strain DSM 18568 / NBRC 106333 / KACC 11606 / 5516J-15) TaxID=1223518 RepID=A0A511N141_DEIC1|nr:sugar ABC transporter substrate-binding protein [Deinococcus cellulosilyticus]GEM46168.1 sugar ABC transporter substrate-binding protein [Deinococcus cellulosilyticus NBRC 106333 = KACC 11606]